MGFEDLPRQWVDLPLDDPRLVTDVLDLVISLQDRLDGGLALLVCDAKHRLVQPCMISDLDHLAPEHQRRRALRSVIAQFGGEGSLVAAIAREDGLSITDDDHAWAHALWRACERDVELLGFHVVTLHGSREVPFARGTTAQPRRRNDRGR
jgi:hypothetical protein